MSSTKEILDGISDYVDAALDAVTEGGGTVPAGATLADLPTAVETIPAPGGGWAQVSYFEGAGFHVDIFDESGCTAEVVDETKAMNWLEEHPAQMMPEFSYYSGNWSWNETTIGDDAAMTAIVGITPTRSGGQYASFYAEVRPHWDASAESVTEALADETEYASLGNHYIYSSPITINGKKIPAVAITAVELGKNVDYIPSGFMAGAQYLTSFSWGEAQVDKITTIPIRFFDAVASFNSPLALPKNVTSIGDYFMNGCKAFDQGLTLPSSLTSIGGWFMHAMNGMTGTVNVGNLPATIIGESQTSFATAVSTAAAYTTGITLVGATASDWKARFPDQTSKPYYRKLIVAS